jgi:hypothetical protein
MSYPSSSPVSRESFLTPLLMNIQSTSSAPSGLVNNSSHAYVPSSFAIKRAEDRDDSLEWAVEHFSELLEKHQGEWVLIRDHRVADSSPDSTALLKRAVARGITNPLMLWVEAPPPPGLDAFVAYGG